jgi:hypothetical protein
MEIRSQHRPTRLENAFLTAAYRGERLSRAGRAGDEISLDQADDDPCHSIDVASMSLAPGRRPPQGDSVTVWGSAVE